MKKAFAIILFFMLVLPNLASAHAELVSSQPKEGETVQQSIDTLTLQFGEKVEKFLSFSITNGTGESIPVDSTSISGKTVLVMTKKPLPQGDYTAKWELVSEDGHNATGELSFKVGKIEDKKSQTNQTAKTKDDAKTQNAKQASDHQTLYISIIVVLIVILGASILAMIRKKQK